MSSTFLPQIKKVVLLMLENRSLDNLLGWLYDTAKGDQPKNVYPAGSSARYDGLQEKKFSNPAWTWEGIHGWKVKQYPVVKCPGNLGGDQDRVPAYDPYEPFRENKDWNGVMNQIFGDQDRIKGLPATGTPPRMTGFLQDYYAWYQTGWQGLDILWTYTPQQLRVINQLARQYSVSDAWFCSVPSQTNPNRAFSLCGTSLGRESNLRLNAVEQFKVPTIFNGLSDAGTSCGLFFTDIWKDSKSYTEYTFPSISKANVEIGKMDRFFALAKKELPAFTYLEPKWGYGKGEFFVQGTDYHPPSHVAPGEQFLSDVYQALRASKHWNETLFIVTFDEHGGTYDHVKPKWGAINPDGMKGKDGFDFNLFGARVPALLISPYIPPSTVFRAPKGSKYPFDHTSLIKTLLLWGGVDLKSVPHFGNRMLAAPTFEGVLSSKIVNKSTFKARPAVPPKPSPGPAGAGKPLNALFEGIPFAATRAIIDRSPTIPDLLAEIAKFKADPKGYLK
jgi:phospholipase C